MASVTSARRLRIFQTASVVVSVVSMLFLTPVFIPVPAASAEGTVEAQSSDTQGSKIMAELAAKRPLRLVIKDARAAGMSTADIVSACLKAGVKPAAVAQVCVAEGDDIPGAITASLSSSCAAGKVKMDVLQSVVSSALDAGAPREIVIGAATQAGCPSGAVAGAFSSSTSGAGGGPVYGYSAPPPVPQVMYVPVTPVIIGGGGGGGSRPASPYKPGSH